jgi:hypothetical protein
MNYYRMYQNIGMHRNASPLAILKGEWKKIINWDIAKIGCATKRDGYTAILNVPDANEILSLLPLEIGTIRKIIMINKAGNLYCVDPVGAGITTWGSALVSSLNTSARWTGTMLHDDSGNPIFIMGNGFQTLRTSDGITFTDANAIDGAPLAPYWASFQERVYGAGVPADKDVLHWCSIGDATNWSAVSPNDSNSLNIDKFFGGVIQNIKMLNDRIVAWKESLVKRWDEEYLRTVLSSDGLDAPYSVAEINGMAFTLDRNAIRIYDGNAPRELSSKIEDLIFGIDFGTTNAPRICGEVFKKKYYLAVGEITDEDDNAISNAWIVYDFNKNAFWLYSMADQATAMCKLKCSDGVQRMYFGGTAGKVWEMFNGDTDDGVEIESRLEGHIFYPEGTEQFIQPKEIIVASKYGHEMEVQLTDDYNDNTITVGEHDKPVSNNLTDELGNNVLGLVVNITHSSKGKPIFYGFSMGYDVEGVKKML